MEKMNIIAKISCYFEPRVVTLKLCKEYVNIVIYNIRASSAMEGVTETKFGTQVA